jgi:hypothetical protein
MHIYQKKKKKEKQVILLIFDDMEEALLGFLTVDRRSDMFTRKQKIPCESNFILFIKYYSLIY